MKTRNYRISDLRWVRPARQERSQRTLERLLDAAEAVIGEKGFADASVGNICTRAGVSVGTFYRRFRDKHALIIGGRGHRSRRSSRPISSSHSRSGGRGWPSAARLV
jgi:DNA-binding transcriptional regulator YbjK